MPDNYVDLVKTSLFTGISQKEIPSLLKCMQAKCVNYNKGEFIIDKDSYVYDFGVMLSGNGRVIIWDESDRIVIITLLSKGSEIGVLLAASKDSKSPVFVQALDNASVLMIPYENVFNRCKENCRSHEFLLRNFINAVAAKGLLLHERIDCLIRPTVRGKILAFLQRLSHEQQNSLVIVPFNRNTMAEYLNIERSSLSRELSNMKHDGVLDYHRNSFRLL